jgi:hypothetical protein
MIGRRFTFGMVFLVPGVLSLVAASSFEQLPSLGKDPEHYGGRNGTSPILPFLGILGERSGRTGLICITAGGLASEASKLLRSRQPR